MKIPSTCITKFEKMKSYSDSMLPFSSMFGMVKPSFCLKFLEYYGYSEKLASEHELTKLQLILCHHG